MHILAIALTPLALSFPICKMGRWEHTFHKVVVSIKWIIHVKRSEKYPALIKYSVPVRCYWLYLWHLAERLKEDRCLGTGME